MDKVLDEIEDDQIIPKLMMDKYANYCIAAIAQVSSDP